MLTLNNRFLTPSLSSSDDWVNHLFNWSLPSHSISNASTLKNHIPPTNIIEMEDSYQVKIAAPGLSKEHFNIHLKEGFLTIQSHNPSDNGTENNQKHIIKEFNYQPFERVFTLKENLIDKENIEAKYENGILEISLPKVKNAIEHNARLIEIQ